jgi:16S rRNA (cytosine967-C5)-methyltransferase
MERLEPETLREILPRAVGADRAYRAVPAFFTPASVSVRRHPSKTDAAFAGRFGPGAAPVPWNPLGFLLEKRPSFTLDPLLHAGCYYVQDSSAMYVGEVFRQAAAGLDVSGRPVRVLDLCAAPGGKTLHAADRLAVAERGLPDERRGSVLARDLTEQKRRLIEENVRRSGLSGIRTETGDAAVFEPSFEGAFDLVIADLPCSGLGVIGRKPEIRFRAGEDGIRALAKIQREILAQAVRYVKPGGQLLYATCTLTEEENRENAARIASLPDYEPADFAARLPGLFAKEVREGQLTVLPAAGRSGFFISLFRRKAEPEERRR